MMNLDRKSVPDSKPGAPSGELKVMLIGGDQQEIIEIHAVLTRLPRIVVETVPTLARLSLSLQKGGVRPDVLLVDVNADNPDDLALIRDLRKVSGIGDTPIVAVTGRSTAQSPLRAMRAGASDVLLKPIEAEDAREIFARVIEARRASQQSTAAVGKAIAFMHLSGGAGATTLAVNAAVALARTPRAKQTCLVDLDIQFGNAASLLDLPSTSPVQDFMDDPSRLDESMLESM